MARSVEIRHKRTADGQRNGIVDSGVAARPLLWHELNSTQLWGMCIIGKEEEEERTDGWTDRRRSTNVYWGHLEAGQQQLKRHYARTIPASYLRGQWWGEVSMARLRPVWMTNHPPSVLWHCWLGHQTCKNRRPYNLYCVGADVKPCSINQSISDGAVLRDLGNGSPKQGTLVGLYMGQSSRTGIWERSPQ